MTFEASGGSVTIIQVGRRIRCRAKTIPRARKKTKASPCTAPRSRTIQAWLRARTAKAAQTSSANRSQAISSAGTWIASAFAARIGPADQPAVISSIE